MSLCLARLHFQAPSPKRVPSWKSSLTPHAARTMRHTACLRDAAGPALAVMLSVTVMSGPALALDPCCEAGLRRCRDSVGDDEVCKLSNLGACARNIRRAAERALCNRAYTGDCSQDCCVLGECPGDIIISFPPVPTSFHAPPLCTQGGKL